MRSWGLGLVLVAAASLQGAACDLGHSCTDAGCSDNVLVQITPREQLWPDGAYRIEAALDEQTGSCEVTLPDDLPGSGSATTIACGQGIEVGIQQRYECTTVQEGGSVSQSCQPIADEYELTLLARSAPKQVSLALSRDGAELLNETREVAYSTIEPNGPECGPKCRQGSLVLAFD